MKIKPTQILHPFLWIICGTFMCTAQQDPQYSQYAYNTMNVNAAYTGSRESLSLLTMYRTQWVGIEGAPKTISFNIDAPLNTRNGLGISIIQDELGPSEETYLNLNYSHTLQLNKNGHRLALGLKGGAQMLSIDWTKGRFRDPDAQFNENINSKLLPSFGAGVFYYTNKFYLGLSTPNIIANQHYDAIAEATATDRIHLFLIAGYVFELSDQLKFKPSIFVKQVSGSPLSADVSANFLIHNRINLGVNYRWDDSMSGLLGIQLNRNFSIGYAYDYSITELNKYNSGTHEVFLHYQLRSKDLKIKSPRFF